MLIAKAPRDLSGKRLAGCVASGLVVLFIGVCVLPVLRWLLVIELFRPPGCRMRVWVKVLDQGGTPVSGYQLSVGGWEAKLFPIGEEHSIGYWITTDQDGMALFDSGKRVTRMFFGENFEGEALKNPNYLASMEGVTLSCADMAGTGEQSNSPRWGGLGKDKDHPLIVHVYKHGPPQKLLRCETGDPKLSTDQYVSFDILRGTHWMSQHPEGDIAMRYVSAEEYKAIVHSNLTSMYGIEVVAGPGCGIQPVNSQYRVAPPETGYKQALLFPRDSLKVDSLFLGPGVIYFYIRNRTCYGILANDVYLVNLDGERNLYYEGYPNTDQYQMKNYITPPVELDSAQSSKGATAHGKTASAKGR
jgi:hypothetical protein